MTQRMTDREKANKIYYKWTGEGDADMILAISAALAQSREEGFEECRKAGIKQIRDSVNFGNHEALGGAVLILKNLRPGGKGEK